MMNIGLAISGNLTGFSRFYANDEAKKLLNAVKFNFDVHNLVSFLNNGEKLYAIFFSRDVVAVSLITNILDSFRRPGNLVVTVLIPRGYKIIDVLSLSNANALYHLLNEINDKFYERNFLNGMVNQNPAVLMQDYYSEILSKFRLEPESSQRKINGLIDVIAPNKKTGYVAAVERSIPSYLSSLFRKSYEGFHYIFFASNAPQNINEPAEEIITYRVRIDNKDKIVPGEVKLSDKIPFISKLPGDKDIPSQDFTYEQVISGEAVPYITGVITDGDTIVLNYNFPKEEKTINFKFYDGANEVPIHIIRPRIESNGISSQLQTNSYLFRGKEIYEPKTIKSGVSEYSIERGNTYIDLQRIPNGGTINICVQHGWEMRYQFNGTFLVPKHIFLTNKVTGERREYKNVTTSLRDILTGNGNEWVIEIYSDQFEPIQIPYGEDIHPIPKKKNAGSHQKNTDIAKRNVNGQKNIPTNPVNESLKISSGNAHTAKDSEQIRREKNKRYTTYGVAVVFACLIVFGCIWGYKALFGDKKSDETGKDGQEELVADLPEEIKVVTFKLVDSDGDELCSQISSQLAISIISDQILESKGLKYSFKFHPDASESEKINVDVKFQGKNMLANDYTSAIEIKKINDVENIRLSVKGSDIKLFDAVTQGIPNNEFDSYSERVQDVMKRNEEYGLLLAYKLAESKPKDSGSAKQDVRNTTSTTTPTTEETVYDEGIINSGFDDPGLTLDMLSSMNVNNETERRRKRALTDVLGSITNGKCPKSSYGLSKAQEKIVSDLIALNKKINDLPEQSEQQKTLKKTLQTDFSNALLINKNGKTSEKSQRDKELSINTAKAALLIKVQ